jgi:hypothetical protein
MKTTIRLVRALADNFSCDKKCNNIFRYIDNLIIFRKYKLIIINICTMK